MIIASNPNLKVILFQLKNREDTESRHFNVIIKQHKLLF